MISKSSRRSILNDLGGGISLAGLMIPEGVAYSSIAGLPPSFGIAAAIVGPLAYAFIGRSRLAVVSATSGAAALLAAAIANAALPDASRIDCAVALTVLVGLFFLIASALRITTLTSFVSRPVLHGFGFGLAVLISIRQLPALLGIRVTGGAPWQVLNEVIVQAAGIHVQSLVAGVLALVLLAFGRHLRFAPAGLLVLLASVLVMRFGPGDHFGIATAGPLVLQAPSVHFPRIALSGWIRLSQLAFPIAIVILAESWATIRSLAVALGDPISARREIAALAMANLASAAVRGLPVGAGFSIGNASAQSGVRSRFGAVVASISVAVALVAVPGSVALIPQPILAAIVISALSHALSPKPVLDLFRVKRDQWIATTTAVGVLVLGMINGLLLAVALSVFSLLRSLAYPSLSELGRLGAHDFVDRSTHPAARPVSGILIIRPNAPLFFGNADALLGDVVLQRVRATDASTIVLSLEESDDLDSSALEALREFRDALSSQKRALILARVHDRARSVLQDGGLADLAESSTFSVDDAVRSALA